MKMGNVDTDERTDGRTDKRTARKHDAFADTVGGGGERIKPSAKNT